MQSRLHRSFEILLFFALICVSPALHADNSSTPATLQGAWKSTDGQDLVRFQPDRNELLGSFLFLEEAFKSEILNLADLEETARYLRRMQVALGLQ